VCVSAGGGGGVSSVEPREQRAVPRPLHQSESRQSTSVNVSSRSSPPKMAATEARSSQVIHFTSAKCSFTPLLLLGTVLPVRYHLYDFYRAALCYRGIFCHRVSVRLSVCPSQAGMYRNDWTNRVGIWHGRLLPAIPCCVIKNFGYIHLPKLGYFPLELCPKLPT